MKKKVIIYLCFIVFSSVISVICTTMHFKHFRYCKSRYSKGFFIINDDNTGTVKEMYDINDKNSSDDNTKTLIVNTKYGDYEYICITKTNLKIGDILRDGDTIGVFDKKCTDEMNSEKD